MSSRPRVLMMITLDTKQAEAGFVRQCLEENGVDVIHLDASIRHTVDGGAEIGPEQVAGAAGKTIEEVRAIGHEGKCQAVMTEGAIKLANALHKKDGLSGVIAVGGSMGTTLATAVMRSLPFGLPKVMVSTMASGMTRGFVGTKDIVMVNSVADIAGLNTVTRSVFRNGALAVAGMARGYNPGKAEARPVIVMSTLGTTERCTRRIRTTLEQKGFEVVVFHTTGAGGPAMEDIVRERDVAMVLDLSLVEIVDLLNHGLCSAGPDRCKAELEKGVPVIFAPGNIDFIIAGPIDDAKARYPGKRYHVHNAALTAVRTEVPELNAIADHMAGLIREAKGPVSFFVPLGGFSSHDSTEGHLYDPSLPPVFAKHLESVMPDKAEVVTLPHHMNDAAFADAIIERVLRYHESAQA